MCCGFDMLLIRTVRNSAVSHQQLQGGAEHASKSKIREAEFYLLTKLIKDSCKYFLGLILQSMVRPPVQNFPPLE